MSLSEYVFGVAKSDWDRHDSKLKSFSYFFTRVLVIVFKLILDSHFDLFLCLDC